jgi:multiple antibiotic resistance protein
MTGYPQFALITFTSLLFIVDPIAVIPTYLVITDRETPDQRASTARRACIATALLLGTFAVAGRLIFELFGITLAAFRIAGGFILGLVALDMLRSKRTTQESPADIAEGQEKEDVALTPLAMPMLAGPGAISAVMVLSGQARNREQTATVYAAIVGTALVCWVVLRLAERLSARLGRTGIQVVSRIMGLMLAAVSAQFIITGVKDAFGI